MNKLLVLLAVAGAAVAVWFFAQPAEETQSGSRGPERAVPVALEAAQPATLYRIIEAIGTTRANESVTITAKVTDMISAINFTDGQGVEKGALLVELTDAEQTAQLAEAKADLRDAKVQLARLVDLAAQGTAPKSQLDEARARMEIAQARLEAIVARLDDRVIRAPFAGVLGFRQVSLGTLVSPGTAITTLDDVSTLKLDFDVPERYLGVLAVGSTVRALSPARRDAAFEGRVTGIGSRVNDVTRSVTVRAQLPNPDRALLPGMLMTVELITESREALAVPDIAVVASNDTPYVYVVDDERIARRRAVETGLRSDGLVEILSGLSAGERVVVRGLVRLRDGASVRVVDSAPAAAAAG